MNAVVKNFVAGEWVEGTGVSRNVNPSNTNDVIGEYARADAAQTAAIIRMRRSHRSDPNC